MNNKILRKNQAINYTVNRSRRARHVSLAVHSNSQVVVTLPIRAKEKEAEEFVKQKFEWLLEKIDFFNNRNSQIIDLSGSKRDYMANKLAAYRLVKQKLGQFNGFYKFKFNRVAIKDQNTRWGSCSTDKNLNFNYRIIFLPEPLVDYLIVHELCHLQELNHGKKFWQLVALTIKDCELKSKQLRNNYRIK